MYNIKAHVYHNIRVWGPLRGLRGPFIRSCSRFLRSIVSGPLEQLQTDLCSLAAQRDCCAKGEPVVKKAGPRGNFLLKPLHLQSSKISTSDGYYILSLNIAHCLSKILGINSSLNETWITTTKFLLRNRGSWEWTFRWTEWKAAHQRAFQKSSTAEKWPQNKFLFRMFTIYKKVITAFFEKLLCLSFFLQKVQAVLQPNTSNFFRIASLCLTCPGAAKADWFPRAFDKHLEKCRITYFWYTSK